MWIFLRTAPVTWLNCRSLQVDCIQGSRRVAPPPQRADPTLPPGRPDRPRMRPLRGFQDGDFNGAERSGWIPIIPPPRPDMTKTGYKLVSSARHNR